METVIASLIKNRRTTLERIEKYISDIYFTDVNLSGKLYSESQAIDRIYHWMVPGEDAGAWQQWKFEEVIKQNFTPTNVGATFGPSWTTHWFKIEFKIPEKWENKEVRIRWKSNSEAMIYSISGEPLQGLSSGSGNQSRTDFCVTKNHILEQRSRSYYIEMVCSCMFGVGRSGLINPPNPDTRFTLEMAAISTFNSEVYGLIRDLEVLHDLAKELEDDQRGYLALYAANQMINDIVSGDTKRAAQIAKEFFAKGNGKMVMTMALIGNCHIDSAWLWPFSETKRKCARSWSSVIRLMEDYPEMVFACSQAQQFAWVLEHYPSLYERIKEKVIQKKFIPTGATWVEMDGLIPSGESFMRQFLYGQQFYEKEFGMRCEEFWLPDTFGYSGQIPQICRHFGIKRFLTQKLSWNLVNRFPNHSFIWEGIDGSTILTHFPPGDSYQMNIQVKEALQTERNMRDKGRVNIAGFLYGYGDGGGGPTQDMLERARRLKDVDGCPRMVHMTPSDLLESLEGDERNLCRWVGELYLELHNGTYTSQAYTKLQNRHCEFALRTSELLLAVVASRKLATQEEITSHRSLCEESWKKVLLNQFHDVLPGSSIRMVYDDSDQLYKEVLVIAEKVAEFCFKKLSADVKSSSDVTYSCLNTLPWTVQQVVSLGSSAPSGFMYDGSKYVAIEAPPLSYSNLTTESENEHSGAFFDGIKTEAKIIDVPSVKAVQKNKLYEVENQFICASISLSGQVLKLLDKKNNSRDVFQKREGENGRGNLITLYDDVPLFWDAWDVMDYHLETRKILNGSENEVQIVPLKLVEENPLRVVFEWALKINESFLKQKIILTAVDPYLTFDTNVTWREAHKFLKAEFDTGLLTQEATFDIQFGHVRRPTHFNTSWDSAKFETCGHKWADLSEYDCGLAVLNNCKYGWSSRGGMLSLSLLRAPKAPDDNCDMGEHKFSYAIMPHKGSFQAAKVIEESYRFNIPLQIIKDKPVATQSWLHLVGDGVMIDAVKVAEDSPAQIVLRLHEMFGGARSVRLKVGRSLQLYKCEDCNGMEEAIRDLPIETPQTSCDTFVSIGIVFWAFQIRTLKLSFAEDLKD